MTNSQRQSGGDTEPGEETVYVEETPDSIFGNVLIDGPDGQCVYYHQGIDNRCPNDAVAHSFMSSGKKIEMCAEHVDGDVPEPDSTDQTELVPDGGTERQDPAEDPRACSKCGVHIGFFGGDYCDGCAREIGVKPPLRRCVECGQRAPEEDMEAIDVSGPDEYYPKFEYLCPIHSGGDAGE